MVLRTPSDHRPGPDANGTIDAGERTEFHADGIDCLGCSGPLPCVIPQFSFAPGGSDEFTPGHSIVTGDRISTYVNENGNTNYMAERL